MYREGCEGCDSAWNIISFYLFRPDWDCRQAGMGISKIYYRSWLVLRLSAAFSAASDDRNTEFWGCSHYFTGFMRDRVSQRLTAHNEERKAFRVWGAE